MCLCGRGREGAHVAGAVIKETGLWTDPGCNSLYCGENHEHSYRETSPNKLLNRKQAQKPITANICKQPFWGLLRAPPTQPPSSPMPETDLDYSIDVRCHSFTRNI